MASKSFSIELQLLADQFNASVKRASGNYGAFIKKVVDGAEDARLNSQILSKDLNDLFDAPSGGLIEGLEQISLKLKATENGAGLTRAQLDRAFDAAAVKVNELETELKQAKDALEALSKADAEPEQIRAAEAMVAELTSSLTRAKTAATNFGNEAAEAMKRAQTSADNAENAIFKLLNIRTGSEIKAEINAINQALTEFKTRSGAAGDELNRVTAEAKTRLNALQAELNGVNAGARQSGGGFAGMAKGLVGVAAAYVGVSEAIQGLKAVLDTAKALDSLNQKLEFATGSAEAAAAKYEQLTNTANRFGLEQISLANGYAQLAAAGKELGLSTQEIDAIFEGTASAVAGMSLTADEANGVFTALSQIAGKGVVSMEELRGQLGERLTPALGIAAKSMGLTTGELDDLISSGGLAAKDFLNPFAQGLKDAFGEQALGNVDTATGKLNLLTNQMTELKAKLAEGFVGDAIFGGLDLLSKAIDQISEGIDSIDPATIDAVKSAFEGLVNLFGSGFGAVLELIGQIDEQISILFSVFSSSGEKVGFLTRAIQGLSVVIGAIRDGVQAISIGLSAAIGTIQLALSEIFAVAAKLPIVGEKYKQFSEALAEAGGKNVDKAKQDMLEFESATKAALDRAVGNTTQSLDQIAVKSEQVYQQLAKDADASAEEVAAAAIKAAEDQIKAANYVVDANTLAQLETRGLMIETLEQGKVVVTALKNVGDAAAGTAEPAKKSFDDLARTLGVDLGQAFNGLNRGFAESKAALIEFSQRFPELKEAGFEATVLIENGLLKMLKSAQNPTEFVELIALIEHMGREGKISGDQLELALEKAKGKADEVTRGINSVTEAFKVLGLQSREEAAKQAAEYLKAYETIKASGQATAQQLQDGFEKYARAAVAANGGVVSALDKGKAAADGLKIAVSDAGAVSVQSMSEAQTATQRTKTAAVSAASAYSQFGNAAVSASTLVVNASNSNVIAIQNEIQALEERDALLSKVRGAEVTSAANAGGTSIKAYSQADIQRELERMGYGGSAASKAADIFQGFIAEVRKGSNALSNAFYVDEQLKNLSQYIDTSKTSALSRPVLPAPPLPNVPGAAPQKTVDVNLKLGGQTVPVSVAPGNESALMDLLNQLGASKSVAGF